MAELERKFSTIVVIHHPTRISSPETVVIGQKEINGKIVEQRLPDVSPFCNPDNYWRERAAKGGASFIRINEEALHRLDVARLKTSK